MKAWRATHIKKVQVEPSGEAMYYLLSATSNLGHGMEKRFPHRPSDKEIQDAVSSWLNGLKTNSLELRVSYKVTEVIDP